MALTKFNESVTNHQSLPDKPSLTSEQLKALFDKASVDIKTYINSTLTSEIDTKLSELTTKINSVYPVGAIYMSVNSTNPSTLFGGTWVEWGAGKVPVGFNINETEFNEAEKTGGTKTHAHTTKEHVLTIPEMPAHNHPLENGGMHTHGTRTTYSKDATTGGSAARVNGSGGEKSTGLVETIANGDHTHNMVPVGGNQPHSHGNTGNASNLQPYITCYMWKRTA